MTKGTMTTSCPSTTVARPSGTEMTRTKKESSATPMMSAGSIMGALKAASRG